MGGHRVTETNLFKILREREQKDGFEGAEISSVVNNVAREAWPILQQVSRAFPLYTLHDPEHSFRVAQNMEKLIPKETIACLNSIELSILLCSAYLHDIGMASNQQELYDWLESEEYRMFLASNEKWEYALRNLSYGPQFHRFEGRERHRIENMSEETYEKGKNDVALRKLQDVIYTDFLRLNHASRGTEWILHHFSADGSSDSKIRAGEVNYAKQVSLVCKSHWEDARSLKADIYRRDICIGDLLVNLQYCAVILRLADLVDLDPERTPKTLLDFILLDIQPIDSSSEDPVEQARLKSTEEWSKQRAILGVAVNSERIRIEAECVHPAIQRSLLEWCEYIDSERQACRLIVQDNRQDITENYELRLTNEVLKDYVKSDGSYIYTDFKFQLDYDRIITLLMGTELWGDPIIALRELLQNALDACLHRMAISHKAGAPYAPRISFQIHTQSDHAMPEVVLTCEDNGMGMDRHIVESFLMRIGRSYYSSLEFRRQNLDFSPISQFGLGIMSCFMLTNTIHIQTQRVDENLVKSDPLLIEIDSSESYIVLRPVEDSREGTAVSLVFKDFFQIRHSKRHGRFYERMMIDEMLHFTLRSLALHLDIPIEISHNDRLLEIIKPGDYQIPCIQWEDLPCIRDRYREFIFDFKHEDTEGLAGKFRFLLPQNSDGTLCLGCAVESRFKMFIDPDGDLVLTTPGYEDKHSSLDFGLPDDWDTDEIRGVYRDKYGVKPPASENRYDSDTSILEIVKGSFRWSQDGLCVGVLATPWSMQEEREPQKEDEHERGPSDDLLSLVNIPGLNAADIDIRGQWRVRLNVQRTEFLLHDSSTVEFKDRFYVIAAKMWKHILKESVIMTGRESTQSLIVELLQKSTYEFRRKLCDDEKLLNRGSSEDCASVLLSEAMDELPEKL